MSFHYYKRQIHNIKKSVNQLDVKPEWEEKARRINKLLKQYNKIEAQLDEIEGKT